MTVPFTTIDRGHGSRVLEPHRTLVRDSAAWSRLWTTHAGPGVPVPPVDFDAQMVAAVFAGTRPSAGYDVEIVGSRRDGNALAVLVQERQPPANAVSAALAVTPFHIVALPRYDGAVRFSTGDTSATPDASVPRPRSAGHSPSSTGLSPNMAAGLAYLAGPFSGILILLAERTSRFVKFHAWQAVGGLGALGLLAAALLVAAFLALFVSATAFTVLTRVSAAAGVLWVVVWLAYLVGAFRGKLWTMPLVGGWAKRRAGISPKPAERRE